MRTGVPAGIALLLDDVVHLGPPVDTAETLLRRGSYRGMQRRYEPYGIRLDQIAGTRILQTAVDRQYGTVSVQFCETVLDRPTLLEPLECI